MKERARSFIEFSRRYIVMAAWLFGVALLYFVPAIVFGRLKVNADFLERILTCVGLGIPLVAIWLWWNYRKSGRPQ